MDEPAALNPRCPRCDYDLGGLLGAWTDQCPLSGRCSECGLGLDWADVFNPARITPAWSFEHTRVHRVRRLFSTLIRTFRPTRLFNELRLEVPVVTWRLVIVLVVLALGFHVAMTVIGAALDALRLWPYLGQARNRVQGLNLLQEAALNRLVWPYTDGGVVDTVSHWVALPILWALLAPLPYLVLQDTMRSARVRPAHLLRAGVYGLVPPLALGGAISMVLAWFMQAYRVGSGSALPWQVMYQLQIYRWVPAVLLGAMVAWWWWVVARVYLRLPTPKRVVAVMLIPSFLAAIAVLAYAPGSSFLQDVGSLSLGFTWWG